MILGSRSLAPGLRRVKMLCSLSRGQTFQVSFSGGTSMNGMLPGLFAVVTFIGMAGAASAQQIYLDFGPSRGYGPPPPSYGPATAHRPVRTIAAMLPVV